MTQPLGDTDELFAVLAAGEYPIQGAEADGVGLLTHGLQCAWELWITFPV